jgi:hypothetical protein
VAYHLLESVPFYKAEDFIAPKIEPIEIYEQQYAAYDQNGAEDDI